MSNYRLIVLVLNRILECSGCEQPGVANSNVSHYNFGSNSIALSLYGELLCSKSIQSLPHVSIKVYLLSGRLSL